MTTPQTEIEPRLYAHRLGIDLHEEYGAKEAAQLCRVGIGLLRRAKENGELNFLQVGERRYKFLGVDLIRWKLSKRIESVSITSPATEAAPGAALGTTPRPSRDDLQALALKTFKKRSNA